MMEMPTTTIVCTTVLQTNCNDHGDCDVHRGGQDGNGNDISDTGDSGDGDDSDDDDGCRDDGRTGNYAMHWLW